MLSTGAFAISVATSYNDVWATHHGVRGSRARKRTPVHVPAAEPIHGELRRAHEATQRLTREPAGELAGLDVTAHRETVAPLLREAGALARATVAGRSASGR
ncbi:hypothetical protein ACWCSV_11310, partial [Streptomyces sp. NPDC001770]